MDISAKYHHACALDEEGHVTCWFGIGEEESYFYDDGQADPPPSLFEQVSTGLDHTCGITTESEVDCWGQDDHDHGDHGQVSDTPSGSYVQVAAGGDHSCALDADGKVACWGNDEWGATVPPEGVFSAISAGSNNTCGIFADTLICWGGLVDDEDIGMEWDWRPEGAFTTADVGWDVCGIRDDGDIECMHQDESYWGSYGGCPSPTGTYVSLSVAGFLMVGLACAINEQSGLTCWGVPPQGNECIFTTPEEGFGP